MEYRLTKLDNGLRILTIPMPSFESSTITVWVKTGSRMEDKKTNGISHFLEHMVFKGSPKYPSAKIVSETIDALGAENNAGTSKEYTNFWIKTANINLKKAFDILADTVLNPLLKQDEIDRERGVVFQEIAMYEDTPIASIGEDFETLIYKGTPLGWKIAGDQKSLMNINHKEFIDFREKWYRAENILVAVAGGANPKKIEELSKKYFSGVLATKGEALQGKEVGLQGTTSKVSDRVFLKSKKTDQGHLVLGFKCEGRNYKGRYAQSILSAILGKGMSSRLFTEVREKRGLAYSVRSSLDRYLDVGTFDVYAGVTLEKIEEAIKVIGDQLFGIADKTFKIEDKEFSKAKSYIKGKLALALEDSSVVNDFFSEQVLFDRDILTPQEVYKKIDGVEVNEVYDEAAKIFKKDKLHLAIIGPYEDKTKFADLLK